MRYLKRVKERQKLWEKEVESERGGENKERN